MKRLIGWSLATIVPAVAMWFVVMQPFSWLSIVEFGVIFYVCLIGAKISLIADYKDEVAALDKEFGK